MTCIITYPQTNKSKSIALLWRIFFFYVQLYIFFIWLDTGNYSNNNNHGNENKLSRRKIRKQHKKKVKSACIERLNLREMENLLNKESTIYYMFMKV
jgi:hypothetical protein